MAIACFRLFTVFPLLPDLSVPFFLRRIALSTRFDAALPYFRPPEDFRAAIFLPPFLEVSGIPIRTVWRVLCLLKRRVDRVVVVHLNSP
jgi:hypothetical protein